MLNAEQPVIFDQKTRKNSMNSDSYGKLHSSFDAQSLMETLGATLHSVAPGHVEIRAPILEGSKQQHGFGHAGLTFSIGDSAAGYAALTTMPANHEVLTAEMKINLLAPARGEYLIATGKVIKPGKRLVIVTAEVHAFCDGVATQIALLQGTMVPVKNPDAP